MAALPRLRQLDSVDVEGVSEDASPLAEQVEADSSAGAAVGSTEDQRREGEQACPGTQLLPAAGSEAVFTTCTAAHRHRVWVVAVV